jgi:hypothetical protein
VSTKIFNGYRLAERCSPFELVVALRERLMPLYEDAYLRAAAALAAWAIDGLGRGDLPREDSDEGLELAALTRHHSPVSWATSTLEEAHRRIRQSGRRSPRFDFECEVSFLADPQNPADLYALLFTERQEYREAFEALAGVEGWAYWDNTDRPDCVSEEAWDERRRSWERVVGWDTPARRGLTWSLLGAIHPCVPTAATLATHLPTRRQRAVMAAERSVKGWEPQDGFAVLNDLVSARADEIEATLGEISEDQLSFFDPHASLSL